MRATMGVSGRRLGPDAGDRHAFWLMLHQGVRLALEAEVRGWDARDGMMFRFHSHKT